MARIIKKNNSQSIADEERVRVTKMGSVVEIQVSSMRGKGGKIKKIDKEHYIDTDTGEVKKFKKHNRTSRKENYNSIYKTLRTAKEIINSNFRGIEYTSWLTLTYAENMSDVKQFDRDFEAFIKRIRRRYSNNKVKYFIALEFGANGGFHCHCLLYWDNAAPVFTEDILNELWDKGISHNELLKSKSAIRNIGAYLTSYLSDMPLEEYMELYPNKSVEDIDIKTVQTTGEVFEYKKIIKNARLELYPPNFRIFRHSKNMDKARKSYDKYENVCKDMKESGYEQTYKSAIDILTDNDFVITQQYEYYELPE